MDHAKARLHDAYNKHTITKEYPLRHNKVVGQCSCGRFYVLGNKDGLDAACYSLPDLLKEYPDLRKDIMEYMEYAKVQGKAIFESDQRGITAALTEVMEQLNIIRLPIAPPPAVKADPFIRKAPPKRI
jgi:hypothetical protein